MRHLLNAQGRNAAATGKEEYCNSSSRPDFAVPNFQLIKKMLNLVRDSDSGPDIEFNDLLQNTFDHVNNDFEPKAISTPILENNLQVDKRKKEKYRRNVAITSLLEAINRHNLKTEVETKAKLMVITKPLKLLKPTDFVAGECSEMKQNSNDPENASNTVNSRNSLLQRRIRKQMLQPKFKFNKNIVSTSKKEGNTLNSIKAVSHNIGVYVPSPLADKYFQKYMGRSYVKQLIKEELWSNVEIQIQEIDKKKKLDDEKSQLKKIDFEKMNLFVPQLNNKCWYNEKVKSDKSVLNKSFKEINNSYKEIESPESITQSHAEYCSVDSDYNVKTKLGCSNGDAKFEYGMQKVKLKQHRHLLTEDCLVCKVLRKIE